MFRSLLLLSASALLIATPASAQSSWHRHFVFGSAARPSQDDTAVNAPAPYGIGTGFGFEGDAPVLSASSAGGKPFFFSFDAPEGNYKVTVTLGGDQATTTTVKAELRRLMLETVATPAGGDVTKTFIVNVRTPNLVTGGQVRLKAPRESVDEARDWDSRITLEFDGDNPEIRSIDVVPADVPTIYLLGDSTVCDQMGEPWAAWGQMLPRFFKPTIAIANHAESGETVSDSNNRYRFAKILSEIKPGDVFITQFGHNDMKEKKRDPDAPAKYKAGLIAWVRAVQAKGATAVIVTSMNRHTFKDGKVYNSLEEYPQLAREAAAETGAALIDLNAQSKTLYETLGEQGSLALFEHNADGTQRDATHQSPYGAYELAKIIVQGLRDDHLAIAQQVKDNVPAFDPAHPDAEADFHVPPSAVFTAVKPFGS
ncbi:rhamnogalacturonan acetylesterase [Asticcacaulis sp. EMRT-3]|uniref:rhamnogalacturonan acetylesterase n=1 Tax=Asticcacaulis sp. EMRT-3 TaxID=3040349 RepID=UPI0024AFCA0A|nr:rhamnogalacturonan acetylesterase [Asticcacaulis sp. EMRT-3]MDI7776440.1 rhamnogalacturonan acetylesterase [Asticcacaulis sp. EMRT-3]